MNGPGSAWIIMLGGPLLTVYLRDLGMVPWDLGTCLWWRGIKGQYVFLFPSRPPVGFWWALAFGLKGLKGAMSRGLGFWGLFPLG